MTSRVYTLVTGGWLVTREGAEPVMVGALPIYAGLTDAAEFVATLRMYADDVASRSGVVRAVKHCDKCDSECISVDWIDDDGEDDCVCGEMHEFAHLALETADRAPEGPPRPILANCGAVLGWVWRGQVAA